MQQIFVEENLRVDSTFTIGGEDARHLSLVLRMKAGEILRVSALAGENFLCEIMKIHKDSVTLFVKEEVPSTELDAKIYLFQAIPKGDRMETVIEKAVELGVFEIIPVEMKYCVVKLDDKRKEKRVERYRAIAESAAKQSKRSYIPQVHDVMTFEDALAFAKQMDIFLLPYESKEGMKSTKIALKDLSNAKSIAIMIGPEGGFSLEEIEAAKDDAKIISLGSRILRTDTAAITAMSMVMLGLEMKQDDI